ncbi:protein of unknown function (plasmid) [Azospirillum baldaniorum]|uniref:Uncharacterized protein n=1 Tax=Azospirillum baldaniorum TaxID=1064539 RepID=A0A9P1NNK0_9PROT|nr:protein of unknown function [Azospirillum baldaniorum]
MPGRQWQDVSPRRYILSYAYQPAPNLRSR